MSEKASKARAEIIAKGVVGSAKAKSPQVKRHVNTFINNLKKVKQSPPRRTSQKRRATKLSPFRQCMMRDEGQLRRQVSRQVARYSPKELCSSIARYKRSRKRSK